MSVKDPKTWRTLKPTKYAREYENPLSLVGHQRIIELNSPPYLEKISIEDIISNGEELKCTMYFEDGSERRESLFVSEVTQLLTKDKPGLKIDN